MIDDHDHVLSSIEEILQVHGYTSLLASSAQTALSILEIELPDLILCDLMMPRMDGLELHRLIKQKPQWCEIPFILLTALSSPEEVRYARERGCDDCLSKPFDPRDLISAIKGRLELSKQRERLQEEKLNRYRRRIIHTLSHEFRTPLVAINTGTELLLDQYKSFDEQKLKHLLLSIQRGGQRLQRLVEDFMLLQQIDSGTAFSVCRRMRRKASLYRLVETAIESFQETLGDEQWANIECKNAAVPENNGHGEEDHLIVVYDIQIIDVINRLLSNAYKFGGTENIIVVSFHKRQNDVSVTIQDHGPGVPEHVTREAFELFTQIDREKLEQQGCGVGLTIAKYFTEINDGKLHFRNTPDGLEVELSFSRHSIRSFDNQ